MVAMHVLYSTHVNDNKRIFRKEQFVGEPPCYSTKLLFLTHTHMHIQQMLLKHNCSSGHSLDCCTLEENLAKTHA